jgi:PQQ-dependent catabolism-associated CXXCW motif protein
MFRRLLPAAACALALAAGGAWAAEAGPPPPQPEGYWTGPMHGRTPASLTGATVVDAAALARLIATDKPLLLDVAAAEVKPPDLPAERWRPVHRSAPGAVWLPGGGADEAERTRLAARVAELTGGRRDRPVVTFCHRDCWASWNAAKRLVQGGYSRVYWFSDGVEGWQEAYAAAEVRQDPVWASRPGREAGL